MYTILKIKNLTKNEVYIVQTKDNIRDISKYTIRNNRVLDKIENCEIEQSIIEIVRDKTELDECLKKFILDKNFIVIDNRNFVLAKDKNGNRKYIDKNSESYKKGEWVGIRKGIVTVKDKDGNFLSVNKDDPRYLSKEYVHITTGTRVVKDKDGNSFVVSVNDERIKTNELVGVTKGKKIKKYDENCYRQQKLNTKYQKLFPNFNHEFRADKGWFVFKNYCEHGTLRIKQVNFKYIYNNSTVKNYCEKCNEQYLQNLVQTKEEIEINRKNFNEFIKKDLGHFFHKKSFLKMYFPDIFKSIENTIGDTWIEKCFCFRYDIKINPHCAFKECTNDVDFAENSKRYNLYCKKHMFTFSISDAEKNILTFIKSIYNNKIIQANRSILEGKEIDILLPDKSIGIEYNGFYNHSDFFKNQTYHYDKWNKARNKNIQLITIWEEDWFQKPEIIKSILKSKLGLLPNKIGARETEIKLVGINETREFLEHNHIQGFCISAIRLGLYFKSELVSIMTFGSRKISKDINKKNKYELLRFCNKLDTTVIGAASKLFKHFLENYHPSEVITFSSCDYSNGNLYKQLGFKELGHTGVGYWWTRNGHKYNRINFMKHKLVESGNDPNKTEDEIMKEKKYAKVWNSGNLKWIYEIAN